MHFNGVVYACSVSFKINIGTLLLLIFVGHNFREFAIQAKHLPARKITKTRKLTTKVHDYNAVTCSHPVLSVMHAVVSTQPRVGQCYVSLLRGCSAARHSLLSHVGKECVTSQKERLRRRLVLSRKRIKYSNLP